MFVNGAHQKSYSADILRNLLHFWKYRELAFRAELGCGPDRFSIVG